MAMIKISTLILLLTAISSCSAQGNKLLKQTFDLLTGAVLNSDGASTSGLSSEALGGIVAGVFIGVTACVCIALFGFCCWNNYQDSRMNYSAPSSRWDNNQSQPGEHSASRLCACIRGGSVCLQTGCCWHEEPENSQHQSSSTLPSYYVDVSADTDANLVAPSINATSNSNDATDPGTNVSPSSDVIVLSDVNNKVNISRSTTPSPSLDKLIVKFNIGVANDDHEVDVTASEGTNVMAKCEVNTSAAGLISETLIVNVDVINNEADVAPPPDVDATEFNNVEDTVALGSPDD